MVLQKFKDLFVGFFLHEDTAPPLMKVHLESGLRYNFNSKNLKKKLIYHMGRTDQKSRESNHGVSNNCD